MGYANGRMDIESWTGGPEVPPGVRYAQQDLPLIVSGGQPNPNLSDGPQWGATLGNAIRVWRSGIGDRPRHNRVECCFLPDGKLLASGNYGGMIRLWSVATHHEIGPPLNASNVIFSVACSPDGRTLASGGGDRRIPL